MEEQPAINVKLLQSSTIPKQAKYLRDIYYGDTAAASRITRELLSLVESDILPPLVVSIWLSATGDPSVIAIVLGQQRCVFPHRRAIPALCRRLRDEKTIATMWSALGGTVEFAEIIASLSVKNTRLLFSSLRNTSRTQRGRAEREKYMLQLLKYLWNNAQIINGSHPGTEADHGPFQHEYAKLVPACGGPLPGEWCQQHSKTPTDRRRCLDPNRGASERQYVDDFLSGNWTRYKSQPDQEAPAVEGPDPRVRDLLKITESDLIEKKSPADILDQVIVPFAKRLHREICYGRKDSVHDWNLIILCLQKHPVLRRRIKATQNHFQSLITYFMKSWDRLQGRPEYSEIFATLISLMPKIDGFDLIELVHLVASKLKYKALRLFLHYSSSYGFDIGPPNCTDTVSTGSIKVQWPNEIFFHLPPQEALLLWERLRQSNQEIIAPYSWDPAYETYLYTKQNPDSLYSADSHLSHALLIRRNLSQQNHLPEGSEEVLRTLATDELPRRMKKAAQQAEPHDRAKWASSALSLSVAIGDMEIYANTIIWARRFNNDPWVIKELYRLSSLFSQPLLDLLAAVPSDTVKLDIETATTNIKLANNIIKLLFETSIMASSERSFNISDWSDILSLAWKVPCERMKRVNDFQSNYQLSDEQLYDVVWKQTLEMIIYIETELLLNPLNVKFQSQLPLWPDDKMINAHEDLRPSTIRFLNEVLKFKDSLWEKFRTSENPLVLTLGKVWPRGFPIQDLFPGNHHILPHLPYALSRLEAVLFPDPNDVLTSMPEDEKVNTPISDYINDWNKALKIYLRRVKGEEELRQERVTKTWDHATVNLSKDRMSKEEAVLFWLPKFKHAEVTMAELGLDEKADQRPMPFLPLDDDAVLLPEWNPDPAFLRISEPSTQRRLTPTCLDAMLWGWSWQHHQVVAVIPAQSKVASFWYSMQEWNKNDMTCQTADAITVSGLLTINSTYGSDTELLRQNFPTTAWKRIPALCLDQEFVERESESRTESADIYDTLEKLRGFTPPSLLVQLARSLFQSIKLLPDISKPYEEFAHLIRLISKSNCPSLANPLIEKFLLEHPRASSWHRLVLHKGHLHRLPFSQATEFMKAISRSLIKKLNEQYNRVSETSENSTAIPPSLVKISTLNLLTELHQDSLVIHPAAAIEFMSDLLKGANHYDIRVSAVKSLIATAMNTNSSAFRRQILDLLDQYASPIASSINERQPFTDWESVESSLDLPEVMKVGSVPPMMELLLGIDKTTKTWPPEDAKVLRDFKFSILKSSAENHRRWMSIFFKKYGFKLPKGFQLPAVPVHPVALDIAFSATSPHFPIEYIAIMKEQMILNISPPKWLFRLNKRIDEDTRLSESNAGRHWRSLWETKVVTNHRLDFVSVLYFLAEKNWTTGDKVFDTKLDKAVQDYALDCAEATFGNGWEPGFKVLTNEVMQHVDNKHPIWRRILDRINGMRTPEWQSNPKRKPRFLLSSLPLKLKMLNLPNKEEKTMLTSAAIEGYAEGIVELLEEVVTTPYADAVEKIKKEVENMSCIPEMAVALGSTPALENPAAAGLVDMLRVELATELLKQSEIIMHRREGSEEDVAVKAEAMVLKWQASSVEYFREKAKVFEYLLPKNGESSDSEDE